jgi:hypothetical protein
MATKIYSDAGTLRLHLNTKLNRNSTQVKEGINAFLRGRVL